MSYPANGNEDQCDQNGNLAYAKSNPKTCVLQILNDTLRRSQPGSEHILNHPGPTDDLHEELLTGLSILNENPSLRSSEFNFTPGDKLSSPSPPISIPVDPDALSCKIKNCPQIRSPTNRSHYQQCKQCHLSTVLGSARRCLKQLVQVKEGLSCLASQDECLSKGKKISNPSSDYELIASLGKCIMYLTQQAFTPAHRLYTAALGLHMSEDLIRNPTDPTLLNFKMGYIIRPNWNSIIHTQMKLRGCVDSATEMYHTFGREASSSSSLCVNDQGQGQSQGHVFQVEQMHQVMVTLMHAFQDLYSTALGSTDIFKVLLHIEDYGENILQEFLLSMESMERSDLLLQVQALRRSFDDIVIMIEQLSWAAYVVYRLASGKSLTPSPNGSVSKLNGELTENMLDGYDPGSGSGICSGPTAQVGRMKVDVNMNPVQYCQRKSNSNPNKAPTSENLRTIDSRSREALISSPPSSSKQHGQQHGHAHNHNRHGQGQEQGKGPSSAIIQNRDSDSLDYDYRHGHGHQHQNQNQWPQRSSSRHSGLHEPSHSTRYHKENKDHDHHQKVNESGYKSDGHGRVNSNSSNGKSSTQSSRKNSLTSVRSKTPSNHGKTWLGGHKTSKSSVHGSRSKSPASSGHQQRPGKVKSKSRN